MRLEFMDLTASEVELKVETKLENNWRKLIKGLITYDTAYEDAMSLEKEVSSVIIDHKNSLYGTDQYFDWDNVLWHTRSLCAEQQDKIVREYERKNK